MSDLTREELENLAADIWNGNVSLWRRDEQYATDILLGLLAAARKGMEATSTTDTEGEREWQQRYIDLVEAVRDLYNAAYWIPDRACAADRLWFTVRNAAGIEPGHSPTPIAAASGDGERCRKCGDRLHASNPTTLCIRCQQPSPSPDVAGLVERLNAGIPQGHQESGYFANDNAATKKLLKKAASALTALQSQAEAREKEIEGHILMRKAGEEIENTLNHELDEATASTQFWKNSLDIAKSHWQATFMNLRRGR